jgi:hypothetical protein
VGCGVPVEWLYEIIGNQGSRYDARRRAAGYHPAIVASGTLRHQGELKMLKRAWRVFATLWALLILWLASYESGAPALHVWVIGLGPFAMPWLWELFLVTSLLGPCRLRQHLALAGCGRQGSRLAARNSSRLDSNSRVPGNR